MPIAVPEYPNLAIELLSAAARASGQRCDVLYGNLLYAADAATQGTWGRFSQSVFAHAHRGVDVCTLAEEVVAELAALDADQNTLYVEALEAIDRADKCIDECAQVVLNGAYGILGLSVGYEQQKLASLALARRVKQANPAVRIIFGGTGCDDAMGMALLRNFPEVDVVVQGEADNRFCALVNAINTGEPLDSLGPILYRDGEMILQANASAAVFALDELPLPDYRPFFAQQEIHSRASTAAACACACRTVLIEASRGCWWGKRNRCTFCGITSVIPGYREKSPDRFLTEFKSIVRAYDPAMVFMTDSIMPHSYYRTVLPAIARWRRENNLSFRIYFEIKSNVRRRHVALLAAAGALDLQPGIEAFSTRILGLVNKGADMLQQVAMLKWARAYNVWCIYNLIYNIPEEMPSDYAATLSVIRHLHHLQPPNCNKMRLFRSSRYSEAPGDYGIMNIRPFESDRRAFGLPDNELMDLCYDLDYDYAAEAGAALEPVHNELGAAVNEWACDFREKQRTLTMSTIGDTTIISRFAADQRPQVRLLTGLEAQVYRCSEEIANVPDIAARCDASVVRVKDVIDGFVADGIMLEEGGKVLALAVPRTANAWGDAGLADGRNCEDEGV